MRLKVININNGSTAWLPLNKTSVRLIRKSPLFTDDLFDTEISLPLSIPNSLEFRNAINRNSEVESTITYEVGDRYMFDLNGYPTFSPPISCELLSADGNILLQGKLFIESYSFSTIECTLKGGLSNPLATVYDKKCNELGVLETAHQLPGHQTLSYSYNITTAGSSIALVVNGIAFIQAWAGSSTATVNALVAQINTYAWGFHFNVVVTSVIGNDFRLDTTSEQFDVTISQVVLTNITIVITHQVSVGPRTFVFGGLVNYMQSTLDWVGNGLPGEPKYVYAPMVNKMHQPFTALTGTGMYANVNRWGPNGFLDGFEYIFNGNNYQLNCNATPFVYTMYWLKQLFLKYGYTIQYNDAVAYAIYNKIVFINNTNMPRWTEAYTIPGLFTAPTIAYENYYRNVIDLNKLLPSKTVEQVLKAISKLLNVAFIPIAGTNVINIIKKNDVLLQSDATAVNLEKYVDEKSVRITRPVPFGVHLKYERAPNDEMITESVNDFDGTVYTLLGYFDDIADMNTVPQVDHTQTTIAVNEEDNHIYRSYYNNATSLWGWIKYLPNTVEMRIQKAELDIELGYDIPMQDYFTEFLQFAQGHKLPIVKEEMNGFQYNEDIGMHGLPFYEKKEQAIRFMAYAGLYEDAGLTKSYPLLTADARDEDGTVLTNVPRLLLDGDDGLFKMNWELWLKFLLCGRTIECDVVLTETDWLSLDLSKKYFWRGSYFLIEKAEIEFPVKKAARMVLRKIEYLPDLNDFLG